MLKRVPKGKRVLATGLNFTPARARVTDGDERNGFWDQHVAERPEFGEYPGKTSRVIPVIVLERVD